MPHETLVDVSTLAERVRDPSWVVVDCRIVMTDPGAAQRSFAEGTIPGAVYANLDDDLSAPHQPGRTGRHPLPTREAFAATLGRLGIDGATQVVAFDDKGGAFASRLWWMLRWMGHRMVAVLDGGLAAWTAAGHALEPGGAAGRTTKFEPREPLVTPITAEQVMTVLDDPAVVVFDARAAARFRGENETFDPIAGHIAGARSLPFVDNLGPDGRFRSQEELATRFTGELAGADPAQAIAYCGSGVTACHDLLAMAHAGLPMARLYPGSWSDWITDPGRPRATSDDG